MQQEDDDKMVQVGEEFPGFVQAESTRGQALVDKFVETYQEYGLDVYSMMGQRTWQGLTELFKLLSGSAYQTPPMSTARPIA